MGLNLDSTSSRTSSLTLAAARRRQSPRTGFIHEPPDVIPLYENMCVALALLSERQVASVVEGKELALRLLAFQTPEGNFPVYLHDFPRSFDPHMGLKLAPLMLRILQGNPQSELGQALEVALQKSLAHAAERRAQRAFAPLWEFRYQVLCDPSTAQPIDTSGFSADDWWEYWITLQFLETPRCPFYDSELQMLVPEFAGVWLQAGYEPAPHPIEWMAAVGNESSRLLKDHVRQLHLPALGRLEVVPTAASMIRNTKTDAFRLFWGDASIHTLVMPHCGASSLCIENEIEVTLQDLPEMTREDLFEIALFCDASPETSILIEERKATVFALGETVAIVTPQKTVRLKFEKLSGEGEFCGHVFRSNRPGQTLVQDHSAYDWRLALRTLRRSSECTFRITLSHTNDQK